MKLIVEGLSCVGRAEIDLHERLTLLAGRNASGKSSILRALAALLSSEKCPITGFVGRDAQLMVQRIPVYQKGKGKDEPPVIIRHDGPDEASASLVDGEFSRTIVWRAAGNSTITGTASPEWDVSRIATGLDRFCDLPAKDEKHPERGRYVLLAQALDAKPTAEEFKAACPSITDTAIAKLTPLVEAGQWDEALAYAEGEVTAAKLKWRDATGKNWTSKAGPMWEAEGLPSDRKLWTRAHLDVIKIAREDLKAKIGALPEVLPSALVAQYRELVAHEADAIASFEEALVVAKAAQEAYQAAMAHLANTPPPGYQRPTCDCPACGVPLVINGMELARADERPAPSLVDQQHEAHDIAARAVTRCRIALEAAANSARDTQAVVDRTTTAKAQLAAYQPPAEGEDREALNSRLATLNTEGAALKALINSTHYNQLVLMWMEVATQCKPDGLRGTVLARQLKRFNARLWRLGLPLPGFIVSLDDELQINLNGRPWAVMSGAERWIANAEIQLVLAEMGNAPVVLLDGADILSRLNRNAMFIDVLVEASAHRRIVVAGSSEPDETADLAWAELGLTYWLEQGTVEPFSQDEQEQEAAA